MPEQDLSGNPVRELGKRFFITFLLGILVYRLGAVVPVPGVSSEALRDFMGAQGEGLLGQMMRWANMFTGHTIERASIFGLGVMPYISASIIFQLLAFSVPALKELQKEGESGRRKINQYTRYAAVLICLVQSGLAARALMEIGGGDAAPVVMDGGLVFVVRTMLVVTTGSMVLLWLADQITKHGVGNGVSVIIMIGILFGFPGGIAEMVSGGELPPVLGVITIFLLIVAAMVIITLARRGIQLEQQRRVQGNRVYGGAQTQVPLMLNQASVIPVIFASPVMLVLTMGLGYLLPQAAGLFEYNQPVYRYFYAGIIIFFTFFYISITVDLNEWANNFKQSGFFIRGVKPGAKTVEYLRYRLIRITVVGAVSLAAIAILPEIIGGVVGAGMATRQALLGGVGLLIVVGVSLDVIKKVSSYLMAHQYQGLIKQQQRGGGPGKALRGTGGKKRF